MSAEKYFLPKGYLSASSISTLLRCPRQYEFRYVEGKVIAPNAALATGSIVHETLEGYFNEVIDNNTRLTIDQVKDLARTRFDSFLNANEVSATGSEREGIKVDAINASVCFVDNVGKTIDPIKTEEEVNYTFKCGVPFLGYTDLRYDAGDVEMIGDYKIVSKRWSSNQLINSLQFNLYSIVTGIPDITVFNILKGNAKVASTSDQYIADISPNIRAISFNFSNINVDFFDDFVKRVAQQITSGIFPPCSPDSWCCSPKWCGYWGMCRGNFTKG